MESTLNDIRNLFDREVFKNEQHIRVCVVCRILQELGWNVWNPDEVNLEFAVAPDEDQTKVDVALRSIQGFDAKKAADNVYRLARLLNEELYVRLYWRDEETATHPAEEALIHWRP
ncbi:MAG TPA: hypothetical protein VF437_06585 [Verrucomicrobiae bacterium]